MRVRVRLRESLYISPTHYSSCPQASDGAGAQYFLPSVLSVCLFVSLVQQEMFMLWIDAQVNTEVCTILSHAYHCQS